MVQSGMFEEVCGSCMFTVHLWKFEEFYGTLMEA